MGYFIGPDVDESKCLEEAIRKFNKSGKKSWIHRHKFTSPCNDECYLAPKPAEPEEVQRAFN